MSEHLDDASVDRSAPLPCDQSLSQRLGRNDAELVAESIPHIVWTATRDGSTTYFNRRGTDYTGCPREANYDWDWVALVHPDDMDRARGGWAEAIRTPREYSLEYRIRRFDGVYRWHSFRALPMKDEHDDVYLWIGTATDIDEQKRLELSLREAEQEATETLSLLESVESATPVGFKLVDRDLRVVRINRTLAELNGCAAEDVVGRRVEDVVPDLWQQLEPAYRRSLAGETVSNIQVSTPSADDPTRLRHWLTSYYPVRVCGEIIGVGNVVAEITELSEARDTIARNLDAMVDTIATTVEYRDPYTAGHQRQVAEIAAAIAAELGLDAHEIDGIRTAASIHDLGKISIPSEILSKPGKLSAIEYELTKQHAEAGYSIVAGIDFPWPVAEMIRQHHERLDGSGYPHAASGQRDPARRTGHRSGRCRRGHDRSPTLPPGSGCRVGARADRTGARNAARHRRRRRLPGAFQHRAGRIGLTGLAVRRITPESPSSACQCDRSIGCF